MSTAGYINELFHTLFIECIVIGSPKESKKDSALRMCQKLSTQNILLCASCLCIVHFATRMVRLCSLLFCMYNNFVYKRNNTIIYIKFSSKSVVKRTQTNNSVKKILRIYLNREFVHIPNRMSQKKVGQRKWACDINW